MSRAARVSVAVLVAGAAVFITLRAMPAPAPRDARAPSASLGLRFEPNVGQSDPRVDFVSRGSGYTLLTTRTGAVLKLTSPRRAGARPAPARESVLGLRFLGARPHPSAAPAGPVTGVSNYLRPGRRLTGVPGYSKVVYRGVYDGIDLAYHASRTGELEFDLTLAPGADPWRIRLGYSRADSLRVDRSGGLVLRAGGRELRQAPPRVFQSVGGSRREIGGRYVLRGPREVGFALDDYDRRAALLIDPVLTYSTYLGGSGDDSPIWSDVDDAGNFYAAGQTSSTDFPTTPGAYQTAAGGGDVDAFVTKLDPSGSGLVFSTYLGGSGADFAIGLDVDRGGNVVVTGGTDSADFPTTPGAFDRTYNGGALDTFVTKLDAHGSAPLFSTFLGGPDLDLGFISFFDRAGNVLVEGDTGSPSFPTTAKAYQPTYGGGPSDGYVTKLKADGSALLWSTFIGGSDFDGAHDGTLSRKDEFFIDGPTSSQDFPTTKKAFQPEYGGGDGDAWVAKLAPDGAKVGYSSYVGGSGNEDVFDLTVDHDGRALIPGPTSSEDFPVTKHAFQGSFQGGPEDGYVIKLDKKGHTAEFATYLGGSGDDLAGAVRVDDAGNAYVPGLTESADFPVTADAFQPEFGGGAIDAFVAVLDKHGRKLRFSSFLGGSGDDGSVGAGTWLDGKGHLFVPGFTSSTDFPVTSGAYQTAYGGGPEDAFLVKIDFGRKGGHGPKGHNAPARVTAPARSPSPRVPKWAQR